MITWLGYLLPENIMFDWFESSSSSFCLLTLLLSSSSNFHRNSIMAAINLKITANHVSNDSARWRSPYKYSNLSFISNSSFHGRKVLENCNKLILHPTSLVKVHRNRLGDFRLSATNRTSKSHTHSFDVVIIGAGIIGLTIARQFLLESNLSVAVLDAAVPCSGATGAGATFYFFHSVFSFSYSL